MVRKTCSKKKSGHHKTAKHNKEYAFIYKLNQYDLADFKITYAIKKKELNEPKGDMKNRLRHFNKYIETGTHKTLVPKIIQYYKKDDPKGLSRGQLKDFLQEFYNSHKKKDGSWEWKWSW